MEDETKIYRDGDQMVRVTVEKHPAIVDFDELLEATRVEPDEDMGPPWKDHDGWEHEAVQLRRMDDHVWGHWKDGTRIPHYNPDDVVRSERDHVLIRVSKEQAYEWGGRQPNPGQHRQVHEECIAELRRSGLEQIKKWYEHGYSWWYVSCSWQGYEDSVGGVLDDDPDSRYMKELRREVAEDVACQLEKAGYTVTGRPVINQRDDKQDQLRWRIATRLGFASVEDYRRWLTKKFGCR